MDDALVWVNVMIVGECCTTSDLCLTIDERLDILWGNAEAQS